MLRLRFWVAAMLVWLFAFYNIERIHEPINIASFVYVLAPMLAIAVVSFRHLSMRGWLALCAASVVTLVVMKAWQGYAIVGAALPLTITEAAALATTLYLSRRITSSVEDFECGAADVIALDGVTGASELEVGQMEMIREVRRARRHRRPLTVVAVAPPGDSSAVAVNRLIEEVQRETRQKYVNARIAKLLSQQTGDLGVVAVHDNHLVVMLPEWNREQTNALLKKVRRQAEQELGLSLQAGCATFPEEEVTFIGLLERAKNELHRASRGEDLAVERVAAG